MTFTSGEPSEDDFLATEKLFYTRVFNEKLNKKIPEMLFDIYDPKLIKVHPLPDMRGYNVLELSIVSDSQYVPVEEFADYKVLPKCEKTVVIAIDEEVLKVVEELASEAGASYAWNVRNAFLKGGRLRNGQVLHVTDWENEFQVNIVRNVSMCPSDNAPGWAGYRYRFAAAKF